MSKAMAREDVYVEFNFIARGLFEARRRWREWRFLSSYGDLLGRMVGQPIPSRSATARLLSSRKARRREMPGSLEQLRVVGFGPDDDWRRNGVWAAFRRLTDFHLFGFADYLGTGPSDEWSQRLAKERGFLEYVNTLEKRVPVDLAFFTHSGRHISDSLIDELHNRGIWTVVMSGDDKHQFLYPCDQEGLPHQLRVACKADLYWSNWPLAPGLVNGLGGNGWFAPPGADPGHYKPVLCPRDLEIVFVGARYGLRAHVVRTLQKWFRVEAYGRDWPHGFVSFDETIHLFSRATIVLGIGGVGPTLAVQMLKGRDFEVPMCGAAYVTSSNSELGAFFAVGREVVCWSSIEDCVECMARLLNDPERCTAIGIAARERCLRDHTWDSRLQGLFRLWAS